MEPARVCAFQHDTARFKALAIEELESQNTADMYLPRKVMSLLKQHAVGCIWRTGSGNCISV